MAYKRKAYSPFAIFLKAINTAGGTVAPMVPAADYYVSTTGSDFAGTGTVNAPWASLSHATASVITPGRSIYVMPGTYYEFNQCIVAVGVSIFGAGDTSWIRGVYTSGDQRDTFILLSNTTANPKISIAGQGEGVDGSQSISYLKIDGSHDSVGTPYTTRLLYVRGRSNVSVHHCTFMNAFSDGPTFSGQSYEFDGTGPAIYATGNSFFNNTVLNCSQYSGTVGTGCLQIGGQDGMLIYNNTIIQTQKGANLNGFGLKLYRNGYLKNVKIHDNIISTERYNNNAGTRYWDFAIELWFLWGVEIYNNTIQGCVDLNNGDGTTNGAYGYSVSFHHNTVGWPVVQPYRENGVNLESTTTGQLKDVLIYNNRFNNVMYAVYSYTGHGAVSYIDNVKVYNNVVINGSLNVESGHQNSTLNNFSFFNNTVRTGYTGVFPYNGYDCASVNVLSTNMNNWAFENNIFVGGGNRSAIFSWAPTGATYGAVMNGLSIKNNLYYTTGGTGVLRDDTTYPATTYITGLVNTGNITGDPLFASATPVTITSNAHINLGSPAIGAGLTHALVTTDFDGVLRPGSPAIGAYEHV